MTPTKNPFAMRYLPALLAVSLVALAGPAAAGDVRLASPFASHMVLQRDKPLPVWGTADAGAEVTITLGDRRATATADGAGRWSATLDALPAGGPLVLTAAAAGGAKAERDDVLVGDVFLCSGQSNMQFGLGEASDFAAATAAVPPKLRLGKVGLAAAAEPQDHCDVRWQAASPEAAKDFSAVAYFTAYELYRQDPKLAGVPIGLLADCVGATVIESWLPAAALARFDRKTLASSMFGIGPSALYNGMVAPLGRLPLAGVVWYQGEGNAGEPARYAQYLPLLFNSWRQQLAQPDLPFLVVQLPDYAPDWGGVYWQWIREGQAKAAAADPHAGYVVTLNTNDGWDLHPQGKHEIGRRLALLAREVVYHEAVPGRSPAFQSAAVAGDAIRVTFDTGGAALTGGAGPIEGFAVAGDDGRYHAAAAVIDGPDAVVVRSAAVPRPKTVRYAWAGVPRSTLAGAAGLPAAPFRTDDQPVSKNRGEIQPAPVGYVFKSPKYQVAFDGTGRCTSLVVGYMQLLGNADGPWGGAGLVGPGGVRPLPQIAPDGPDGLLCRGGDLSADVRFGDGTIRWSVTNRGAKDAVRFTLAASPQAEVGEEVGGVVAVRRKTAAVTFSHIDRVTTFNDPAADAGGKVLEVTIPAGQTRTIEVSVGRAGG